LSSLALEHRIEPELVYRELCQYRNLEKIDIDALTTSLQIIYEQTSISSKVRWIDLQKYVPSGQEWFKRLVKTCEKHKLHIENGLNKQLGLTDKSIRLRLGLAKSRIYLRLENVVDTDWMQLYSDEMFHFHSPDCIEKLLSESKARLDIKGNISLSRLIHQITDYNKSITKQGMNSDLHHNASYVKGSTLSLLLDSCDMTVQDIEDDIASIGRIDRHLIRNPRFSEDPLEIDKAFARLFGAGLSDGHINQFRVFCYSEADANRIRIFQRHMDFFGDIDYTIETDENGNREVRYSAVIGRILEKRGFPVGDKTVQNRGIPDFILNGPIEVQVEYLRQLWAEDGHFISGGKNHTYFGWTRGISLLDPEKDLKYNNESSITPEMIQLIEKYGTYHEKFDGRFYPRFLLDAGKLKRHDEIETPEERELARRLQMTIYGAKPSLLISEEYLLESIGVKSISSPTEIWYYLGTGRVSVLWRARTKTRDGAMMVAIQAPPDDVEKRLKVQSWIESQQSRYQRVLSELEKSHKYQMSGTDD
jgi:hypothetical protein